MAWYKCPDCKKGVGSQKKMAEHRKAEHPVGHVTDLLNLEKSKLERAEQDLFEHTGIVEAVRTETMTPGALAYLSRWAPIFNRSLDLDEKLLGHQREAVEGLKARLANIVELAAIGGSVDA